MDKSSDKKYRQCLMCECLRGTCLIDDLKAARDNAEREANALRSAELRCTRGNRCEREAKGGSQCQDGQCANRSSELPSIPDDTPIHTDGALIDAYDSARYAAACPVSGTGTDGHIEGLRAVAISIQQSIRREALSATLEGKK